MKHRILDNLGLKIMALIMAFAVWLAVVNANDPVITRTVTGIPVALTNTAYVETLGQSCMMQESNNTVNVTLTGHRSVIEPLTKDHIRAEADLTQIVNLDADPIMVPVNVTAGNIDQASIKTTPGNIAVVLEEMQSSDFMITPTTGDTKPFNTSYQVGAMSAEPESITVTGPASLIRIIDRVTAPVDVSSFVSDTSVESGIVIYDKNGQQFSAVQMDALRMSLANDTVKVDVDIWNVVSDISLRGRTTGEPADGFRVGEITVTPSVISIAGTESAIAAIQESGSSIALPDELVDVSGATEDVESRIDLTKVLPEGTKLADNAAETALVTVEILALDSRTFELPTNEIEHVGLDEGLAVVFQRDKFKVRLQGTGEKFDTLKVSDIKASIDFSDMEEGTQIEVPVEITTPGFEAQALPVTVVVDIVNIDASKESETSSGESDNG